MTETVKEWIAKAEADFATAGSSATLGILRACP